MEKVEVDQPEFLFCEIAIKDNSTNDNRIWIYHRLSLSLIEFVDMDSIIINRFDNKHKFFTHDFGSWAGVFVTKFTGQNEDDVIDRAWQHLVQYFVWEANH